MTNEIKLISFSTPCTNFYELILSTYTLGHSFSIIRPAVYQIIIPLVLMSRIVMGLHKPL
jgi:hypothetical protein